MPSDVDDVVYTAHDIDISVFITVAAITGGTAGIGLGIARAFLAEGASVALMARNPEKGELALEALNGGKG